MSHPRASAITAALAAALMSLCVPLPAAAADAAATPGAAGTTAAADTEAAAREKTRELLAFGIDTQVLEVVTRLRAARDTGFTKELAALLAGSRSNDVRKAVLEMFADLGLLDGQPAARTLIAAWQTGDGALTAAAVVYLSSLKAADLGAMLLPLVDADDAVVVSTALRAIGMSRDPGAVEPLLAKLASVEYPDARKGEVVTALGELRDPRAVDALLRIAKSRDEEKTRRLFATDALGKIGDRRALPVLRDLFAEDDALVRAYAASALAAFGMAEALPSLLAGLRDANVKVRLQCTKALARPMDPSDAAQAVPAVRWKADNDPDRAVRLESVRTLGEIADTASVAYLEALLQNTESALDVRETALSALLSRTPGAAGIRATVERELGAKDQKPIEMMARVLSQTKAGEIAAVLTRLLDSQGWAVRLFAVRGLVANGVAAASARLAEISEKDVSAAVRTEAARAVERLKTATPSAPTSSGR
jgi:HEAT repeat protein